MFGSSRTYVCLEPHIRSPPAAHKKTGTSVPHIRHLCSLHLAPLYQTIDTWTLHVAPCAYIQHISLVEWIIFSWVDDVPILLPRSRARHHGTRYHAFCLGSSAASSRLSFSCAVSPSPWCRLVVLTIFCFVLCFLTSFSLTVHRVWSCPQHHYSVPDDP